jgi:hypothetical protein
MAVTHSKPPRANHEEYRKTDRGEYGLTSPREGTTWSGTIPIPARGERVFVRFNGFGNGTVRGYFIERGSTNPDGTGVVWYLGVYVECDKWPAFWLEQTADDPRRCMMAFGAELLPEKPAA